ncbi:cytotoxin [Rickettsia bellii]|uniref:Cytotoxic translational repressor of toxin-antitoxin (TA) system RelE n=3 Tax=Rickettsia bellii TaxID=33990 RepID=Q1RH92_RICBR|nr:type II toxin-antitoxin system RelE/ParE family toxin [Rickettsia bellii]ABE05272.1 Cytotoxic translational repressor of toxin-antitoxin (TA) system RelE [Rickettsia bellii RML369-C]ABV78657.1 Cytotoxic translational repressor of toxin-antitoxin (TA) system RelE [Rickettsia bellii OSU 85-389]ARD85836.1 cytotoxin [Rickettsia bellii]KJV89142.1 plasmid stabilization system family protein [Rickettsia bellii str. RML An4]KJV92887.1 plasmid stabilization system family protein [Rickettsia bellii s
MREIVLEKRVIKTLERYPEKHQRQVKNKILSLMENPIPNNSKLLVGYPHFHRCDIEEYRIIYNFNESTIYVILVGKRNDSEVYKLLKNIF